DIRKRLLVSMRSRDLLGNLQTLHRRASATAYRDPMKRLTHMICFAVCGVAILADAPLATAQTLAGGQFHSVILTSSGTVWTVGENGDGQLSDNTINDRKETNS